MKSDFPANFLSFIPLLSAALYVFGMSYHEGYLEIYGLDISQFPIATDKALFTGFLSFSIFNIHSWIYAIGMIILIAILYISWFTQFSINAFLYKHFNMKNEEKHPLLVFLVNATSLLVILVVLISIIASTYSDGKKQAYKEQLEYKEMRNTAISLVYKKNDTEKIYFNNARLITCSTLVCAYWSKRDKTNNIDKDIFESYILQLDKIEKLSILPKK